MLEAILDHSCDKQKIHTITQDKWEAASAKDKRSHFTTCPILVTELPDTKGKNFCVTDQIDTLVQRTALGATLKTLNAADKQLTATSSRYVSCVYIS